MIKNGQSSNTPRDSYKRRFDLTILILAHVLLLPVFLVLWVGIPLVIWVGDKGPIFYVQSRSGRDGQVFYVRKFRSMIPGSDKGGLPWTTSADSRVTNVGKILRRTALDELPELLSIWKGDMSLVGPRALDVEEEKRLEQEIPGFEQRLKIRPGLTGLAQVLDLKDDPYDKLRYDIEYIEHMGPWFDLRLLTHSVFNTFTARWDRRSGKPLSMEFELQEPVLPTGVNEGDANTKTNPLGQNSDGLPSEIRSGRPGINQD